MQSNWYEEFFHGLALDLWRKAVTEEQTEAEADFIAGILDLPNGARILDVPCGNGRHSIELAKRGCRMTGVDLCDEFIAEARQAAALNEVNIDWIRTDMRNVHTLADFDGAFCFGNSFGYMVHEETLNFLEAVNRCLRPGARFILETGLAAESLLPAFPGKRWYRLGDVFQLSEAEYPDKARTADFRDKLCDRIQLRATFLLDHEGLIDFEETVGKGAESGGGSLLWHGASVAG